MIGVNVPSVADEGADRLALGKVRENRRVVISC